MESISPSLESKQLRTPEEERDYLRELLLAKEAEIARAGGKEGYSDVAKQTLDEYKGVAPEHVLASSYQLPEKAIESFHLDLSPEEHDDQIAKLAAIVSEHGVKNALSVVSGMNDPHLLDDFDRFLVQYLKSGYPFNDTFEQTPELRALNMTLFQVTLPEKTET